jgi:hypothetical protein
MKLQNSLNLNWMYTASSWSSFKPPFLAWSQKSTESNMFSHGLSTTLISYYPRTLCYEYSFYTWFFQPHVHLPTYICPLELQKYGNSCSPSWISLVCALQLIDITPIDQSVALQSKVTAWLLVSQVWVPPRAWMSVFCYGCVVKVADCERLTICSQETY